MAILYFLIEIFVFILFLFLIALVVFLLAHKKKREALKTVSLVALIFIGLVGLINLFLIALGCYSNWLDSHSPTYVFRDQFHIRNMQGFQHIQGFAHSHTYGMEVYLIFQAEPQALNKILKREEYKEISDTEFKSLMDSVPPSFWKPFSNSKPEVFFEKPDPSEDAFKYTEILSYDTVSHWVYYHWRNY